MSDTSVKLVAQIDATSKGLVNALNQAAGAVNSTTSKMQQKFDGLNGAVNQIGEHVEKLNELISKAGDGALDVTAIQAELKALEQAQSQVIQASSAFDGLADSAQNASKKIETSAQATTDANGAFDEMAKKVKVGGVALQDLKDAFSNSAKSAVAWGNIYVTLINNILSGIGNLQNGIKKIEELTNRANETHIMTDQIKSMGQADNFGKLASTMKELYDLRENWSGTEEDKARELLLQRDIKWLQELTQEETGIKTAIDAQVASQEKLRDVIADTLNLEQKMRQAALQKTLDKDIKEFEEAAKAVIEMKETPRDLKNSLLAMWDAGNINPLHPVELGAGLAGQNLDEKKAQIAVDYENARQKMIKSALELQKLNQDSNADNFYFTSKAQAQDKAKAKEKAQAEEEAKIANAEVEVTKRIDELNLSEKERAHEQAVKQIEEEYNKNIGAGVSQGTAKELKQLQLKQLAEKEATLLQDEENKKQAELIAQIEKRKLAYEQAEKQYIAAEKEVEKAQKNLADVERNLAREKQAEAIRTRRSEIKEELSRFGFSIADGFDPYETASSRHSRVRTQKTDASIAQKMVEWQSGKKVHFTQAEKRRLEEYEGLKEEDKMLEASQLQMDAAKKQENAALSLASAAEVLKNASIRLDEIKSTKEAAFSVLDTSASIPTKKVKIEDITPSTAVAKKIEGETLKGLTANGVTGAMGVSYSDQLSKIQATLQELASKTFRVI